MSVWKSLKNAARHVCESQLGSVSAAFDVLENISFHTPVSSVSSGNAR